METAGVLLLLLNMMLSGMLAPQHVEGTSEVFGRVFAPLFLGLVVLALFSVSANMRNRRSRAKVFLVTMCVILLGSCGRFLGGAMEAQARRGTAEPTAVVVNEMVLS